VRPRSGLYGLDNRRASSITCSECVFVVLGSQNTMRIAILSPVASQAYNNFRHYLIKARFSKKKTQISNFMTIHPLGIEFFFFF
jgi:hypothetical protein